MGKATNHRSGFVKVLHIAIANLVTPPNTKAFQIAVSDQYEGLDIL